MPENNHDEGNSHNPKGRKNQNARAIMLILVIAAILFGVLAFIAWYFVNEHSERIKFLAVNALSLFVLVVIAFQAYVYRREWEVMQHQLEAMTDSLTETRKMSKAAEDSAKTAQRSFHASERPHFGIVRMQLQFAVHCYPTIDITFMNGGNSPAWNFRALPLLTFGLIGGELQGAWDLSTNRAALSSSFVPAKEQRVIRYQALGSKVSQARFDEVVTNKTIKLFVSGTAYWKDSHGDGQLWDFWAVYYPELNDFGNYEA